MKTWMVWILISWVLETWKRYQHRNCAFTKIIQEDYWWKGKGFRILQLTGVLWLRKKWCISCTRSKLSQLQFIAYSSWFVLLMGQHASLAIQKALWRGERGILCTNTCSPHHDCFYILRNVVPTWLSSRTYHIPCFISKDIFGLLHPTASRSNKASCTRHTFLLKPVRKWNYFAMITLGLLKSMSLWHHGVMAKLKTGEDS